MHNGDAQEFGEPLEDFVLGEVGVALVGVGWPRQKTSCSSILSIKKSLLHANSLAKRKKLQYDYIGNSQGRLKKK